jgi:hypothetical protein
MKQMQAMRRRACLFVLAAVLACSAPALADPGRAQQPEGRTAPGLPGVSEPAPIMPRKPARAGRDGGVQAARPCPEYGPGFVRLEGASTCVRASGQVRVDGTWRGSAADGVGSAVRGRLSLDMRTPTQAGPVRVFVRGEASAVSR